MPSLLAQISQAGQTSPKQQYLLLHALNEVIGTISAGRGAAGVARTKIELSPGV